MYLLYEKFIEQIKLQDIQKYNLKHRDYLVRCGKMLNNDHKKENKNKTNIQHRTHNDFQNAKSSVKTNTSLIRDERPLKGSDKYIIQDKQQYGSKDAYTKEVDMMKDKEKIRQEIQRQKREFPREEILKNKIDNFKKPEIKEIQKPIKMNYNSDEQLEQFQEIQLIKCPQNCGRKFKPEALEKHIKICQKKQKKRQVFKVKVVDDQAQDLKKQQPNVEQKKPKVAKWKKESAQLRNIAKINKGQTTQLIQQVDDRVQCGGCGRKFNQVAAKKHIPNCLQRNKMKK